MSASRHHLAQRRHHGKNIVGAVARLALELRRQLQEYFFRRAAAQDAKLGHAAPTA